MKSCKRPLQKTRCEHYAVISDFLRKCMTASKKWDMWENVGKMWATAFYCYPFPAFKDNNDNEKMPYNADVYNGKLMMSSVT